MSLDTLAAWSVLILAGTAAIAFTAASVRLYLSSRHAVVFDSWADHATHDDQPHRGESLADLLLFRIREIQHAHRESGASLDLTDPHDDIPAFQQELDATLRSAVDLQREDRFVGPAVSLMLALMPIQAPRLRGSLHRYGRELRVTVVLENARKATTDGVTQWSGTSASVEDLPALVEELAFAVYLALAGSATFGNAHAFRLYTDALRLHLSYGETRDEASRTRAEALYEEALALEPENPAVLYNLGVLHYYMYEESRNAQAETCFLRALPRATGSLKAQVHSGLANACTMRYHRFGSGSADDLARALHHGSAALRLDNRLDVVLKAAAFAHQQAGQAHGDASGGKDADSAAPGHREVAAGHRVRAVELYEMALATNSRYYTARNNLGNLYLELAREASDEDAGAREVLLRESIDLFLQTIATRPAYHHAYDNLGNAYRELAPVAGWDLLDEAERAYRTALRLKPDYAEAKNDLASLFLVSDWPKYDPEEADRLHRSAVADVVEPNRRLLLEKAFAAHPEGLTPRAAVNGSPPETRLLVRRLARRQRRGRVRARMTAMAGRLERRRRRS